jgi:probable F420-dependent oxidoreductase
MVQGMRQQQFHKPLTRMSSYLDEMDAARYTAALMDKVADDGFAALAGGVDSELPPRPPRVLAALGPRMLALSAEKADGALLYFQTPDHTQLTRETLGPKAFLAPTQMVVLEEDPDSARAAARRILSLYSFLPSFVDHFARLGFAVEELADGGSNRLIDAVFARGNVDAVAKRVQEHLDAGADHVAVQVITPTWPRDAPIQHWRDLAAVLVG